MDGTDVLHGLVSARVEGVAGTSGQIGMNQLCGVVPLTITTVGAAVEVSAWLEVGVGELTRALSEGIITELWIDNYYELRNASAGNLDVSYKTP